MSFTKNNINTVNTITMEYIHLNILNELISLMHT